MSNRTRDGTIIYLPDVLVATFRGAPALQTLRNHRSKGKGIRFRKIKGRVTYNIIDVWDYIKAHDKHKNLTKHNHNKGEH